MNRTDLQQLALERVRDADALLKAGQWSGAYYLAGYAIECALKACIAKMTGLHDFPDKELAQRSYTHNLEVLVKVGGLDVALKANATANPVFWANWDDVKDWDENARYRLWSEAQARKLFLAVTDTTNGVLPWIMVLW